ncbi:uncharacterized protein A1O9_05471 [Exophiala aquamarina CBS 119918]|uniref:Peptidase S59 domain-containing protein n=1 Tax=Exophiala aquamarina CBS 119918 TaxID=1182545 RepID=A0A072PE20_9EURO|nr:uncharacterized protein A1O9_05471 [Exophiala aquamarina CBS 119918]KEF57553.1 hypothetical protein A1O9_05471 [Exophiala aquamarina CBS 119918]
MSLDIWPLMERKCLQPTSMTSRTSNSRPTRATAEEDDMEILTDAKTPGFGNANNSTSLFGNKPASNPFGASTNSGTGLFGNSTNSGGFGTSTGGFGGNNTSAFGSNNNNATSSFSFGSNANKPAFGNTTTATPLFGQGGSGTTSGFGATNAFGSGTALSNQPVPPSEGTASIPFAPHIEKDGTGSTSSAYQSIVFQQPYQKYSFEELRLADYNAGRQYGNNTGQAGGFGGNTFGGFGSTNTNTGGFGSGNTGGGLFGNNATSASTGFGASNTATTGFGGGGLFGNKPATGGLFGSQSSGTTTGGLFGTANNTPNAGGFGSASGGNSLFGNNQQTQNKPSPFGANTTTPAFSFGNTNANANSTGTSGGLFGNNQQTNQSSGGLFGNNTQQQSGGLFGNNNQQQQQQQKPLFGTSTGGFGNSTTQSQTGGGLFGNTNTQNTGGGLFGGNNNQQTTNTGTGLFGSNTNTTGGLFGGNNNANNAQKPGGLFGSSFGNTNTANTGGGLFGNANANQQQSGGLFNNASNTNANSGFSFGMNNSTNKPASTGLFGNTSTNQSGGLFGGSSFGGLGASQNNQQNAQQQADFRVSTLNDPNPYGQTSIWTGLPVPTPDNSKPIFTPLTASQKLKESQSKPPPSLRLNQSRYMTPPRRPGFGFTYSTYGTPNSAASTPGGGSLSNSMYGNRSFNGTSFGGSIGRSFGKSASVNNLRSQFNIGDNEGVLSPNAFNNPGHTRWSGGNMRRLTIDRSIRNDLFSRQSLPALPAPSPAEKSVNNKPDSNATNGETPVEPTKLRKRVSFDKEITGGQNGTLNGDSGALVRTEIDADTPEPEPRSRAVNGAATPDPQQARGNELAVVPEDRASDHVSPKKSAVEAKPDPQPGDYWMKPTRAQISKLPRDKAQEFVGFEVGRKGCGRVTFLGAVDLTALPLDDLYEKIVEIRLRSVTVYPDPSTKPPVGKGLNVPSMIYIENSWPRARGQPSSATSGPIFDKHINRLKKMQGTEFQSYDVATGVWAFKVPHYTRYGLDYDDDDDLTRSQISLPPDSLDGSPVENAPGMDVDSGENDDYDDEDEDDTFAFKQKTVPGGFGKRSLIDDFEARAPTPQELEDGPGSDLEEEYEDENSDNEVSMAGTFPAPAVMESPNKPILKASRIGTPGKPLITLDGDWAEQLQRTISPRKQNREALRDVQSKVLLDRTFEPIKPRGVIGKGQLNTSIDIMNSLFTRHEERMTRGGKGQAGPDFEV